MKRLHPPTAHFIGDEVKAALAAMDVVIIAFLWATVLLRLFVQRVGRQLAERELVYSFPAKKRNRI
jgi:hypothetical protein